jgi:hypothetical protein
VNQGMSKDKNGQVMQAFPISGGKECLATETYSASEFTYKDPNNEEFQAQVFGLTKDVYLTVNGNTPVPLYTGGVFSLIDGYTYSFNETVVVALA